MEIINDFLNNYIDNNDISNDYITPGRKRLLENKKNEIDWDFNQDIPSDKNFIINDKVFHKKFGYGIVVRTDNETAEVEFIKFGIKKVFLKFLNFRH